MGRRFRAVRHPAGAPAEPDLPLWGKTLVVRERAHPPHVQRGHASRAAGSTEGEIPGMPRPQGDHPGDDAAVLAARPAAGSRGRRLEPRQLCDPHSRLHPCQAQGHAQDTAHGYGSGFSRRWCGRRPFLGGRDARALPMPG